MSEHNQQGEPVAYLGDGAYVRFTGYSFVVYTSDGISIQNEVHLEKNELKVLDHFVKQHQPGGG